MLGSWLEKRLFQNSSLVLLFFVSPQQFPFSSSLLPCVPCLPGTALLFPARLWSAGEENGRCCCLVLGLLPMGWPSAQAGPAMTGEKQNLWKDQLSTSSHWNNQSGAVLLTAHCSSNNSVNLGSVECISLLSWGVVVACSQFSAVNF